MTAKFIEVDDCRFHYVDEGSGDPILFIHGIPTSSYLWRNVIAELRDRYRCIAPDLLGLGRTVGPIDADYTMPAQAQRLTRLLDALELEQVIVVAHDQGGAAGQILATAHTDRVRKLALVNCVCYDNWPVPVIKALAVVARAKPLAHLIARDPLAGWLAQSRFGLRMGVHVPSRLSDETIAEYFQPLVADADARERFRRFCLAGDGVYTVRAAERFGQFDKPVRVAWAVQDRFLPVHFAHRLVADFPRASLTLIPDAGHFVQEEQPVRVAQAIAELAATEP